MIKTIIIEDEQKSLDMLHAIIQKHCPDIEVIGLAKNVKEGVALIKKNSPDLIFLDISMPDGSGFDLLKQVSGYSFDLIFATASDKHAIKAFQYSACHYLLKPIDIEELKNAVSRVVAKEKKSSETQSSPNMANLEFLIQHLKRSEETPLKITLPTGSAYEIVTIKDIIRCEADGSYTTFYLSDKRKLMISSGLKYYEELLPEHDFIRVHHHHLLNMEHVVRFLKEDGGYAIMTDGTKIEVSRRKKELFMEKLNRPK